MLLIECAIKWWFIIPRLLTNVSALPGETWSHIVHWSMASSSTLCGMLVHAMPCWHLFKSTCMQEGQRSSQNICYNWPVLFRATHILQEKTHACGILKRYNFRVHVSPGSAETLVRWGGIINHHSITYSISNICAKSYRKRLMWVESIVCNICVIFWGHSVVAVICQTVPKSTRKPCYRNRNHAMLLFALWHSITWP